MNNQYGIMINKCGIMNSMGVVSLKLLGGKLAPKLEYFSLY